MAIEFDYCTPDCQERAECPDVGIIGHQDCGRLPCGCIRHHGQCTSVAHHHERGCQSCADVGCHVCSECKRLRKG